MCGIIGVIGNIDDIKINIVKSMLYSQVHRGPDGHRILRTKSALLGFSRLKIIDFDNRAMQPMVSKDEKYALVFNGEIYNYKQLKNKIGGKYKFNTSSDSEVLLATLILYGLDGLKEINGMFSFCFYDVNKNIYTLVRDRFGQKPLYYSINRGSFYFSSEIKSLLVAGIKNDLNFNAVSDYLYRGKIDCSEQTFFNDINQLEPGTAIVVKNSIIQSKHKWYNVEHNSKIDLPKNIHDRNMYINDTLTQVCEEHLNSDTDIGVNLSGGLDSSTMLASMEKNKKYLSNSCFSVDFGNSLSEKKWIQSTAKYFNKKSIISSYTIKNFLDDFDRMIFTHEGPLGGLMNCAFENVYREANKDKIRVLLDGTGLDEAFGGYRIHHLIFLNRTYHNNRDDFDLHMKHYSDKWNVTPNQIMIDLQKLDNKNSYVQDGSSFNQETYTSEYLKSLDKPHTHGEVDHLQSISDHLINYIICSKIPRNTRIKDRQSMSYSIELRMPFLDHRIIELGLGIEEKNYFDGGVTKSIIRTVMKNKLPEDVRLGQKRSIQAPQGDWLRNKDVSNMVLDLIGSVSFKQRGIFNVKNITDGFNDFLKYGAKNSFHIWQWINLEKFLQTFIDKSLVNTINDINVELIELK
jgi:asparagine synthase (glutamine-hydrolysing)